MATEIDVVQVTAGGGQARDVALALVRADEAIRNPGDPDIGLRQLETYLFPPDPDRQSVSFTATIDGQPAGVVFGSAESDPDDELQVASVEALVHPGTRRQGVALALVNAAVPALKDLGQTSILAYPCHEIDWDAGVALCRHYGMTKRQEERCSRVAVADIDDELMRSWVTDAPASAAGYRIESWVEAGSKDDAENRRLLALWSEAGAGMADAPMDDVDYNYPTRAVEAQRQADAAYVAAGYRMFRTVAIAPNTDSTGTNNDRAAAMTELIVHDERPQTGIQGDTTVLVEHRGQRLGRWLKAANYLQARAHVPELNVLETYNAESNSHMLDINVAMGFRPHRTYTAWQAPIDDMIARIASSS